MECGDSEGIVRGEEREGVGGETERDYGSII